MMKLFFIILTLILIFIGILIFVSKPNDLHNIDSTDLTGISVDLIKIGIDINKIDLTKYENSDRFKKEKTNNFLYFKEMVIGLNENKVNYLFAFNSDVSIVINNKRNLKKIDGITDLLGPNYLEQTEDREQHLLKHVYIDDVNGLVAEFIYSSYDGQFVWMTLKTS